MAGAGSADLVPEGASVEELREAAAGCRACDLWRTGTQTVFGEGREGATVMLVGEQPGDREDREGRPFVGPAGKLLQRAMEEAGLEPEDTYVTNVVKHFKWALRGKRRIHKRPNAEEIRSCRPWLQAEISRVRPAIVVCLGATAARSVVGGGSSVQRLRGKVLGWDAGPPVLVTVHPSSILRATDDEDRRVSTREFVADLATARAYVERARPAAG